MWKNLFDRQRPSVVQLGLMAALFASAAVCSLIVAGSYQLRNW